MAVKVQTSKLFDALGLLRSLQYDLQLFNTENPTKYDRFRLSRQAVNFGVRLNDTATVEGLDSLIAFIETSYSEVLRVAKSLMDTQLVDFDALVEHFKPGSLLVDSGVATGVMTPTMLRARACYYRRRKSLFGVTSSFHVGLETVVNCGDSKFVVVEFEYDISEFQGTRSIHNSVLLPSVPTPQVAASLLQRGTTYQDICGKPYVMVEYSAGSFLPTGKGSSKSSSSRQGSYGQASRTPGRMMVDTKSAWLRGVHGAQSTGLACDMVINALKMYHQQRRTTGSGDEDKSEDPNQVLVLSAPLSDDLLQMTWPVVPGFSLQARTWGSVMVDGTSPVCFQESVLDNLVMNSSRKRLIRALVTSHEQARPVDLVHGKGEGCIFLLHGPPGVGKTLTAEAIAEYLHKPLYVVSMGELGTSPESLEDRLQDILDLCVPWKALILIDEAEMLLERRTKHDIVRNAMVCVMLRLLEYYSGILFLTTNRVESLDPAFQSRVTCALRYDPLTVASRQEIWQTMMERLGIVVEGAVISELAAVDINGRQIKNTLQLAVALARHEQVPVSANHLRETLNVTTSFLNDTTFSTEAE